MTVERKDRGWLRDRLIGLFQDAAGGEKPDHQVCVKYAELLYKLLEASTEGTGSSVVLEQVRQAILEERARGSGRNGQEEEDPAV